MNIDRLEIDFEKMAQEFLTNHAKALAQSYLEGCEPGAWARLTYAQWFQRIDEIAAGGLILRDCNGVVAISLAAPPPGGTNNPCAKEENGKWYDGFKLSDVIAGWVGLNESTVKREAEKQQRKEELQAQADEQRRRALEAEAAVTARLNQAMGRS